MDMTDLKIMATRFLAYLAPLHIVLVILLFQKFSKISNNPGFITNNSSVDARYKAFHNANIITWYFSQKNHQNVS